MRKRAAVVVAVLVALLGSSVPASAAAPLTVTGRVVDETGRPVAGATVRASVDLYRKTTFGDALGDALESLFWGLGCAFSFGLMCDDRDEEERAQAVAVAGTDRNGRYVLRFASYDTSWTIVGGTVYGVDITGPTLVRGTAPARTTTSSARIVRGAVPTFRLWLRGATINATSPTRRRLRAGVPSVLGRPVRPARVVLVQGYAQVWDYGEVARDRDVDSRVVERGTTGTRSTVTTAAGTMRIHYESGVRLVTKAAVPFSRGKRCWSGNGVLLGRSLPGCVVTDGELGSEAFGADSIVVDLGELTVPEVYVARGCDVLGVATSIEGEVYLDVKVQQRERRVYTGKPDLPGRYVRLRLGGCAATELSVYATPYELPLPPAPVDVPFSAPVGAPVVADSPVPAPAPVDLPVEVPAPLGLAA